MDVQGLMDVDDNQDDDDNDDDDDDGMTAGAINSS